MGNQNLSIEVKVKDDLVGVGNSKVLFLIIIMLIMEIFLEFLLFLDLIINLYQFY